MTVDNVESWAAADPARYVLSLALASVVFSVASHVGTAISYGALATWIMIYLPLSVFFGGVAGVLVGTITYVSSKASRSRVKQDVFRFISSSLSSAVGYYWIWNTIWEPGPPIWAVALIAAAMGVTAIAVSRHTLARWNMHTEYAESQRLQELRTPLDEP